MSSKFTQLLDLMTNKVGLIATAKCGEVDQLGSPKPVSVSLALGFSFSSHVQLFFAMFFRSVNIMFCSKYQ